MEIEEKKLNKFDAYLTWERFFCIISIIFYILMMFVIAEYVLQPLLARIFVNGLNRIDLELLLKLEKDEVAIAFYPQRFINMLATLSATLNLIVYIILFLVIGALLLKFLIKEFKEFQQNSANTGLWILIGLFVAYGAQFFSNLLVSPFLREQVSANQQSIEMILAGSYLTKVLMIFTTVVLGPFVEEVVFRRCVFKIIPNTVVACLISTVCFGALHTINSGYSFVQFILHTFTYSAAGLAFCFIFIKTKKNVFAPWIVHALMNGIAMIISMTI